jgi:hypothetical protein
VVVSRTRRCLSYGPFGCLKLGFAFLVRFSCTVFLRTFGALRGTATGSKVMSRLVLCSRPRCLYGIGCSGRGASYGIGPPCGIARHVLARGSGKTFASSLS